MNEKKSKQDRKQAEAPVVTAEDAERMYAQAWPAKQQAVTAEIRAAGEAIGQKYGVTIHMQLTILPAFLAGPVQGNLPTPGG